MGQTTARGFRDKLAMRNRARAAGIPCPEFVHVAQPRRRLREWTARVAPPWVLKPRSQAAAIGIRRLDSADELWRTIDALGDAQADYVLEQFVPGDVYHVDSIVFDGRIRFAIASRYRHAADGGRARRRHLRHVDAGRRRPGVRGGCAR